MMMNSLSKKLLERAKKSIPGGVNSPVRAFKSVGGIPVFMQKAKGAIMTDVDGHDYIDYINSWGPMILGHGKDEVNEAIKAQIDRAISFGTPTELEIEIAELVKSMAPNVDLVRFVNSGTEACMSALRLARGYTNRNKFIKFEGCYHGHADPFLVKAGSGVATLGIQSVPGVTSGTASDTLVATFNDLEHVKELFEQHKGEIAAVIIEPVAGNMGCIPPAEGFLEGIRALCDEHQSVFIFDEVMTGFRLAKGGAQEKLNIDADLITYGKIIGGGMPVGAFGGKKEIMDCIAPVGQVYQAGTLSGNPLAVTAGITTLNILNQSKDLYDSLNEKAITLKNGIHEVLHEKGIAHKIHQLGSMMSVFFTDTPIKNFKDVAQSDIPLFNKLFHHLLKESIYLPPSAYETWFLSDSLNDEQIEKTIAGFKSFNN